MTIHIHQYVRQQEAGEADGPRGPWSIRRELEKEEKRGGGGEKKDHFFDVLIEREGKIKCNTKIPDNCILRNNTVIKSYDHLIKVASVSSGGQ